MTKDFIYPFNETVKKDCKEKKEAGSVLNQMLLVLETMKDDLEHRKKYLKAESCMNEIVCCTRESSCTRE